MFAIITGFALLFYPFGYGVLHLLVPTILTYLVMLQIREYSATLSWVVNFTYLVAWYDSPALPAVQTTLSTQKLKERAFPDLWTSWAFNMASLH